MVRDEILRCAQNDKVHLGVLLSFNDICEMNFIELKRDLFHPALVPQARLPGTVPGYSL